MSYGFSSQANKQFVYMHMTCGIKKQMLHIVDKIRRNNKYCTMKLLLHIGIVTKYFIIFTIQKKVLTILNNNYRVIHTLFDRCFKQFNN